MAITAYPDARARLTRPSADPYEAVPTADPDGRGAAGEQGGL